MTSNLFQEQYKKLNPEQKLAVDTVEGPVMVIAGPGTGKTQILTLRIANILLQTDTSPFNILAITFTESGVAAMRKRLVEIIGNEGYKVEITTFHALCNEIIKSYPENFRHLSDSQAITDLEQIDIIEKILFTTPLKFLKPFGDPIYYTKALLGAINDLKKEAVSIKELEIAVKNQEEDFNKIDDLYYVKGAHIGKMKGAYQDMQKQIAKNKELVEIYKLYQKALIENKFFDYSDMIMEVLAALEKDSDLLLSIQEKYQYILVDEHQDTNFAQNRIIELFSSFYDLPNLFIVGDEKQAIYRFQGASLENFLYFKTRFPDAKLINLSRNYRSTQAVLDASGSVISYNQVPEEFSINQTKLLSQSEYPNQKVKVAGFNNPESEMLYLSEDINQKIENGVNPREIAIIFRNNRDVLPIVEALEKQTIPYFIESDQDLLADIEIRKILMLLRASVFVGEDLYLVPVLHIDIFNISPMDIFKLIRLSRTQHLSLFEIISSDEYLNQLILEDKEAIKGLYKKLSAFQKMSENDHLENVFINIIQQSGMVSKALSAKNPQEQMDKITTLYQQIKTLTRKNPQAKLKDFLGYVDLLQTHQLLVKRPLKNPNLKAVRLMTAHRSKGLEFEYVYIVNVFDGHWGNKRSATLIKIPWDYLKVETKLITSEFDPMDDERRLFYVAMTRAKKEVTISYSRFSEDGKEQLPSQFIEEIGPEYKDIIDTNEFEETVATDGSKMFMIKNPAGLGLKDPDFFRFLFEQEGLSATALNNYLKCPWRYFYSNMIQVPFMRERSLIFGTAIHESLGKFAGSNLKELKAGTLKNGEERLLKLYENALKAESLSESDYQELLDKGESVLKNYFPRFLESWNNEILSEYSIRGVMLDNNVKINGRIDKIEKLPNSNQVILYDLKTGKPKSRNVIQGLTQSSTGDYFRQIYFYKLLVDNYQNKNWVASKGAIEFVEPDDRGNFHLEEFDFDPEEVENLKQLIFGVSEDIKNLAFWDKSCGEKDCQYCLLRSMLNI